MRRLALLVAGGAVWLFLAAIPVFADGGPHVAAVNNGSVGGLTADSCAGCHRIHTSQSPTGFLLTDNSATVTDFCRSCHGASGTGASTDVDTGVQYTLDTRNGSTGTVLGALRGGGFLKARIATSAAYRVDSSTGGVSQAKIPVAGATNVTSAHLAIAGNGITPNDIVWGNGDISAGSSPGKALTAEMECTSCHNPHGNGQYRILRPIPTENLEGSTVVDATTGVSVSDATYIAGRTRNYTVIQAWSGTSTPSTGGASWSPGDFLLYADQVLAARGTGSFNGIAGDYSASSGDYLHKTIPYDTTAASGTYPVDAPNGLPNTTSNTAPATGSFRRDDPNGYSVSMANWCSQCHTRYRAPSGSRSASSGDSIFMYRHTSIRANRTCTSCHVAHGSNAAMNTNPALGTTYSANVPYPNGTVHVGDSRLLKVDNRGICEMCHDPTEGSASKAAGSVPLPQGPTPLYRP